MIEPRVALIDEIDRVDSLGEEFDDADILDQMRPLLQDCKQSIEELEARVHEVYEAYANMEGFPITTDNEKYLMRVIEIMRDEAKPPDKGITISLECAKWNARQLKGLHYQAGLREDLSTERMHLEYMQELNAAIAKHTGEQHE